MLDRALVVRAGFLKHVVERPRAFGASGILAFCGHDQISLQDLLLPQAPLFLSLGEVGGWALGASSLRLPLVSGKMAPIASSPEVKLVAMSRSTAAERGTFRPNSRTKSRQVVLERKAWTISESPTLGNSVHCLEKRRMKSRRDSSGFWRQLLRS